MNIKSTYADTRYTVVHGGRAAGRKIKRVFFDQSEESRHFNRITGNSPLLERVRGSTAYILFLSCAGPWNN